MQWLIPGRVSVIGNRVKKYMLLFGSGSGNDDQIFTYTDVKEDV